MCYPKVTNDKTRERERERERERKSDQSVAYRVDTRIYAYRSVSVLGFSLSIEISKTCFLLNVMLFESS